MEYLKQEITEFTSTNLVDAYPDWNSTTTYILEADGALTSASVVRYGTYYYRSVTNSNLNFNPVIYENIKWVKLSISNKFAMLDLSANSKSVIYGNNLTVTFLQGQISTLAIGNYEGEHIKVEILAPDGSVQWTYETPSNINKDVYDYYTYIYAEYNVYTDFTTKIDLPFLGRYVRVTILQSLFLGRASCGYLVGGTPISMGKTIKNVSFAYNSFASKDLDESGALTITKRGVQELVDFETTIASTTLITMKRELKKIYNDILVFILDERTESTYENLMTLGVIQDAKVLLDNDVECIMTYSVMEAI